MLIADSKSQGLVGRDWNRAESVAGLWAYHRTYGGSVSRGPGSPVAIAAERIGRAVPGVYNKVMNFRVIDPRDEREGLTSVGAVDRAAWDELYDSASKTIRAQALEAEFDRLWPAGSDAEPESEELGNVISVMSGRRGQGFIVDPRVRRAVEDRAMDLAEGYYRERVRTVKNTPKTKPFDFVCWDNNGNEIRVKVKCSTGGLEENSGHGTRRPPRSQAKRKSGSKARAKALRARKRRAT